MLHSGIATTVLLVATRYLESREGGLDVKEVLSIVKYLPLIEMPHPPPMVMPSMIATYGTASLLIVKSKVYSSFR